MNDLRKALFRALEKSDINMLRAVLAQGVSLAYEEGDPEPVFFALAIYRSTDIESLQLLLSAGADITVREFEYQDSLLHWYVNEESDAILPWLIAQGLDVNAQNVKGRTPLTFAVYGLHPKTRRRRWNGPGVTSAAFLTPVPISTWEMQTGQRHCTPPPIGARPRL